ncbi:MAG: hypothetical protein HOO97_05780 [Sideroxydans sp.]|nr:hypothetical protein [Sideroxydans sp.]
MLGFQQCCDAYQYDALGAACLSIGNCWNEQRPIGAVALSATLGHAMVLLNHTLLFLFARYLIRGEVKAHLNIVTYQPTARDQWVKTFVIFSIFEVMFSGLASVMLSDVAAGVFAAFAILGFMQKDALLLSIAGAISVLIRAAYLYPILVIVVFFLAESLFQKRKTGVWAALFFVGIAPQFWLTYVHTGVFAFLDPATVNYWREFHFSSNWAGYDTLVPAQGFPWKVEGLVGFSVAYQLQQWGDMFALIVGRINFYFSSFVLWGKVYLSSPSERIFTPIIGLCSFATFVASVLYLKASAWRLALPLSLILMQSLIIVPEQRFIFVIQLFLVVYASLYCFQSISGFKGVFSSDEDERGNK